MSKKEILITPIGEMFDMISCLSIYEGGAKPKKPKISVQELLRLK